MKQCIAKDCTKNAIAKGLCSCHYMMKKRWGNTDHYHPTAEDRFFSSFNKNGENGCWEMQKGIESGGYGRIKIKGLWIKAHRYSWIFFNGTIPDGLLVCHKCDNKKCVNPKHLFLGTPKDNTQDMIKKGRNAINIPKPPYQKKDPLTGRWIKE
jgi:hypothetical protein